MSNDGNRMIIVLAAAGMIVLMALVIFITWSANTDAIDSLGDLVEWLDENNDSAGKLIVTLAALIVVVLSLLVIVVELAPEDEERELRVKQEGATTIVPAAALRARIEEALVTIPAVTAAKAKVTTRDKGIATSLDLVVTPGTNIGVVTQDATRVVTDTVQSDLGLPVAGHPNVRVSFGGPKAATPPAASEPTPGSVPGATVGDARAGAEQAAVGSATDETPGADEEPAPSGQTPAPSEPPAWAEEPSDDPSGEPGEGESTGGDLPRDPWRQP